MKSKQTKKALLVSALSLVLCLALLVGATFAWFTDSVTSGKNTIVAGNLDVELYQVKGDSETKVTADTNIFDPNALWEPGHTEVAYLRVANEGTLALKYKFAINVASQVRSKNVNNEYFYLSDYIKFAVVETETVFADRAAARAAAETAGAKLISEGFASEEGHLKAGKSTEKLIAIVVYMPETVGNEANYDRGKTAPSITLGIELLATQDTVEKDSFDETYDEKAEYAVLLSRTVESNQDNTYRNEIKKALESGKNVILGDSITASNSTGALIVVSKGESSLNLNGKTIENTGAGNSPAGILAYNEGTKLTICGDGTVNGGAGGNNQALRAIKKAEVTIEGGTFIVGADAAGDGNSCIEAQSGAVITITGGFFKSEAAYAGKYWVLNLKDNDNAKIIVKGGTFVNFNPAATGTEPEGVSDNFVAEGYKVVSEEQPNGDIWYTVVPE